jgi:flagellar biosynthetic protein FlhB
MSGQRTEAPTARRREEARRKGEGVGRSHEFAMALTLGTGVLALSSLLPGAGAAVAGSMRTAILEAGQRGLTPALMIDRLGGGIGQAVGLVLPLGLLVVVAGVAGNLVAGGLVFSTHAMRIDLARLNPVTGIRRIVDRQAMIRLAISSAKLVLLAFVSWQVVGGRVPELVGLGGASAGAIAGGALDAIFQLGLMMTILLSIVALADFVVQRRRASGQLKMTKEDVKREFRESEGDPLIQAQRRRRARQMAFARMMDAVPTADVVITNPIHLAVALKYDSLTMGAPRLVAKGQRLMAARIKDLARANGVPIVEDVPLARALYPRPLGSEVSPHLYRAVARILVLVQQTRFAVRRPAASASRPRPFPTLERDWPGRQHTGGTDR